MLKKLPDTMSSVQEKVQHVDSVGLSKIDKSMQPTPVEPPKNSNRKVVPFPPPKSGDCN